MTVSEDLQAASLPGVQPICCPFRLFALAPPRQHSAIGSPDSASKRRICSWFAACAIDCTWLDCALQQTDGSRSDAEDSFLDIN